MLTATRETSPEATCTWKRRWESLRSDHTDWVGAVARRHRGTRARWPRARTVRTEYTEPSTYVTDDVPFLGSAYGGLEQTRRSHREVMASSPPNSGLSAGPLGYGPR
ncbi:hypothetical protein FHX81_0402 [Saccharothrix saharensis]|uniref:Uncharacterized protein n=1 Tax=Saccharothrix saharensis TaxID=571190 RepID=A0A543J5U0_9PSEU|nr:hypothetical protein FHX81_0402 [Saccharothrix saharensis]